MISFSTFYTFKCSFPLEFKWLGTLMTEMLTTNKNWTYKLIFNTFRKRIKHGFSAFFVEVVWTIFNTTLYYTCNLRADT